MIFGDDIILVVNTRHGANVESKGFWLSRTKGEYI